MSSLIKQIHKMLFPFKKSSGYNCKIVNLKGIELFTWGYGSNDLEIIMSGLRDADLLLPSDSVIVLYKGIERIKVSSSRKNHQKKVSSGFLLRQIRL